VEQGSPRPHQLAAAGAKGAGQTNKRFNFVRFALREIAPFTGVDLNGAACGSSGFREAAIF